MPLPLTAAGPIECYKKAYEITGLQYAQRADVDVVMMRIAGIWGPLDHAHGFAPIRLPFAAIRPSPEGPQLPAARPPRNRARGPIFRSAAYMDTSRIRQDVGYAPEYPLERAVPDYMDWLRDPAGEGIRHTGNRA